MSEADKQAEPGQFASLAALGRPRVYLPVLVAGVAAVLPMFVPSFVQHVLIMVFITGTAAVAWNIIGGFGGQFSLGNAVFLGIGAYSTAILAMQYDQTAWVGIAVGVLLSVLAAVIIGKATFRLSGHYFALATIAIVEGMAYLAEYFSDFTGGSQGMSLFASPGWGNLIFASKLPYYYLMFAMFLGSILISVWVRYSRLGYYLLAIREDQDAAAAIGVNPSAYKLYGFVLSAALTALAGGMYSVYIQFISPSAVFSLNKSILYALIALIGGMGTLSGPIVGAVLMVSLQEYMTTVIGGNIGALSYVIYGVLLIVLIVYAPEGLVDRLSFVGRRIADAAPQLGVTSDTEGGEPQWRN